MWAGNSFNIEPTVKKNNKTIPYQGLVEVDLKPDIDIRDLLLIIIRVQGVSIPYTSKLIG